MFYNTPAFNASQGTLFQVEAGATLLLDGGVFRARVHRILHHLPTWHLVPSFCSEICQSTVLMTCKSLTILAPHLFPQAFVHHLCFRQTGGRSKMMRHQVVPHQLSRMILTHVSPAAMMRLMKTVGSALLTPDSTILPQVSGWHSAMGSQLRQQLLTKHAVHHQLTG